MLRDVDRAAFLEGDGQAIAGAGINLDDLLLSDFVIHMDNEASVEDPIVKIVDDNAVYFRSETLKDTTNQVVSLRAFPRDFLHRHGDGRPHSGIYVDDKDLVIIAQKHGAASICREDGANFGGDDLVGTHSYPYEHGGHAMRLQGGFI